MASNVFNRVDIELTEAFPASGFSQRLVLRGEQDAFKIYTETNQPSVAVSSPQGTAYILPPPFAKTRTIWLECLKGAEGSMSHEYWNDTANMAIGTNAYTFLSYKYEVTNIKFNHDTTASTHDALNLRWDYAKTFDISNGEWDNTGTVLTNHPACYVTGVTPTVMVRFTVEPASITNILLGATVANANSVLADLVPTNILFQSGVSVGDADGYVTLTFAKSTPSVIRKSADTWEWYSTEANGMTIPQAVLGETGPHTNYVIFAESLTPWDNTFGSPTNAWVSALDIVCSDTWAGGAATFEEAISRITMAIFGSGRFKYDIIEGRTRYRSRVNNNVLFSQFINRLQGKNGNGESVNCTDCANFMVTFANLIGCPIYASRMGDDFETNEYCAIGCPPWTPPSWGWGFSYHEVAWTGLCDDSDFIFDACLQVNGNGDPSTPPRTPIPCVNMLFSDGDSGPPYVYRESLAAPGADGYDECLAQPLVRIRRGIE